MRQTRSKLMMELKQTDENDHPNLLKVATKKTSGNFTTPNASLNVGLKPKRSISLKSTESSSNTKWTPNEEIFLLEFVHANKNSLSVWDEISKHLNRTQGACRKRLHALKFHCESNCP